METVSKCSDETDDGVQLQVCLFNVFNSVSCWFQIVFMLYLLTKYKQVIKVLLMTITSVHCEVHEASLLLAVRACFHIHLISKNLINKTTAKAALTQIISATNQRMEIADADQQPGPPLVIPGVSVVSSGSGGSGSGSGSVSASNSNKDLKSAGDRESAENSVAESGNEEDGSGSSDVRDAESTLKEGGIEINDDGGGDAAPSGGHDNAMPATATPDVERGSRKGSGAAPRSSIGGAGAGGGALIFPSVYHKDAYLLFRALCKLSMKGLSEETQYAHSDAIPLQNK